MSEYAVWLIMSFWGLISCLVFILGYGYKQRRRWYLVPMGRHLMAFSVALGVAYAMMVVSLLWGPLGPWPWIFALLGINVVLSQRIWYLFTKGWIRDPLVTGTIKTSAVTSGEEGRSDHGAH